MIYIIDMCVHNMHNFLVFSNPTSAKSNIQNDNFPIPSSKLLHSDK